MANRRLPVRKIKEVLRLKHDCNLSEREIARSCHISRTTVTDYLSRAKAAGLGWPEAAAVSEYDLVKRLFPDKPVPSSVPRPMPDCQYIYNELRTYRKLNLTLAQLWLEYKDKHPDGYQYSQYCEHYRRWRGKLDYCMRQEHRGGEKVFVDYGDGLSIVDPSTGELTLTQLFLAVWGASNYTYAEASLSQTLPDWTGSHRRAFEYFGCAPRVLVPDNLKSGVHDPCFYEPEINPTYADMAQHYDCAVLPARPAKPRDKAKVEAGVLIAKRWILAVLRHRTFCSLAELNAAIWQCLERLNTRPLRQAKKSRREIFEAVDQPNALPLPQRPYEYAEWSKARVSLDYHVEVDGHYYSVPYRLLHEKLDIRKTATTVEVFRKGERVAAHARSHIRISHTTSPEHMPSTHRYYSEWNPVRLVEWAGKTGEATAQLVERILATRPYPEQGYRACLGIIHLGRHYEPCRVEAAARRALTFNACSYRSMKAILKAGLDQKPEGWKQLGPSNLRPHHNIRGQDYYQQQGEQPC